MFVVLEGPRNPIATHGTTPRRAELRVLFPEHSVVRHAAGCRRRIPCTLPSAALPTPSPSLPPPVPPPPPCYSRQGLVWRPPPAPSRRVRRRRWSFGTGKLPAAVLTPSRCLLKFRPHDFAILGRDNCLIGEEHWVTTVVSISWQKQINKQIKTPAGRRI